MKTFVYDTETTGFIHYKKGFSDAAQPYLVQIGGMLFDDDTRRVLAEINLLATPSVLIPPAASEVHGITDAMVQSAGLPYNVVLPMFNNIIKKADRLVCHNVDYDLRIMHIAYCRMKYDMQVLKSKPHICTMQTTTPILKLPHKKGGRGYKWPNLQEAYKSFVDEKGFEGAHDAMEDVRATSKVFWSLVDSGHPLKEKAI